MELKLNLPSEYSSERRGDTMVVSNNIYKKKWYALASCILDLIGGYLPYDCYPPVVIEIEYDMFESYTISISNYEIEISPKASFKTYLNKLDYDNWKFSIKVIDLGISIILITLSFFVFLASCSFGLICFSISLILIFFIRKRYIKMILIASKYGIIDQ